MGKGVIVLVLGSIIIFGIMNQSVKIRLTKSTEEAADYYSSSQARNIAASTVSMCLSNLSGNSGWRATSPQDREVLGGAVRYRVVDTLFGGEQLVKIWVESRYGGVTRNVTAFTEVPTSSLFKNAVESGGEFVINGQDNLIRDDANPGVNANIHTNSNMILNVQNFQLRGFATYSGTITANWGQVSIIPNQNPDNLPVHFQRPPITIPAFDPNSYNSLATVTHNGDATYTGAIVLGSAATPKIIRVKGKLFIKGVVSGYGVFIVNSDIEINGHLTTPGATASQLGLYTNGKVLINQTGTILHAHVFANGEVNIGAKNARIYGSITTTNKVTFNAEDIQLFYRPVSGVLTNLWGPASGRLAAKYYYE